MKEFVSKIEQAGFDYPAGPEVAFDHSDAEVFLKGEGLPVEVGMRCPIIKATKADGE